MVYCTNIECGVTPTLDNHDIHCKYLSQISLISTDDYSDRWQITYQSLKQSQSSGQLFEQFVFVKITSNANTSLLFEPLIRKSCDYSFQTEISFRSSLSIDKKQIIYTLILPSCNTEEMELCTYYIVIEATSSSNNNDNNNNNNKKEKNKSFQYELSASLGILLQFQQKYSYQSYINSDDNNTNNQYSPKYIYEYNNDNNDIKIINSSCIHSQFYGISASLTDFPIGIIVQPEFIDTDALFTINEFTSSPNTQINTKQINKLKGDAVSESYHVPSLSGNGHYISNEDYILLHIFYKKNKNKNTKENNNKLTMSNIKYIIYSQSNISYIQVSVINSGGWFLMLILVFLILIAMCRKHCCLSNDQRLSYDEIVRNIQLQNPLFTGNSTQPYSNPSDELKVEHYEGVTTQQLDKVSIIEIYHKKIFYKSKRKTKYKSCCICLYDYKNNDKIRKLNCNHYFHQTCIDIWFKRNIQCPLCKQCVINAHILSKRSNTTNSENSSSLSKISNTSSSKSTSISDSDSDSDLNLNVHININDNNNLEQKYENKYSLSDSHCIIYNKNINHKQYVSDDMYIIRNRHSQSYSGNSYHHSSSSNASEIIYNNNNHMITNTNTNTTNNTNSNDISLSSSPIRNNNDFCDDLPLSTFISQSLSSHKKQ